MMQDDDLLAPAFLEKLVQAAQDVPGAGLVFCRRSLLASGKLTPTDEWLEMHTDLHTKLSKPLVAGRITAASLFADPHFFHPPFNKIGEPTTTLLTREALTSTGLFNTTLKQSLDYEYSYRLLTQMDAVFVDEDLAKFRLHGVQATQKNHQNAQRTYLEPLHLYRIYGKTLFRHFSLTNKSLLLVQFVTTLGKLLRARLLPRR